MSSKSTDLRETLRELLRSIDEMTDAENVMWPSVKKAMKQAEQALAAEEPPTPTQIADRLNEYCDRLWGKGWIRKNWSDAHVIEFCSWMLASPATKAGATERCEICDFPAPTHHSGCSNVAGVPASKAGVGERLSEEQLNKLVNGIWLDVVDSAQRVTGLPIEEDSSIEAALIGIDACKQIKARIAAALASGKE